MAIVIVPSTWRDHCGGQRRLHVVGATLGEVVADLRREYPGLAGWLDNGHGSLPTYTQVFVGERDVRTLALLDTPLADRDEVRFIPEMSGG